MSRLTEERISDIGTLETTSEITEEFFPRSFDFGWLSFGLKPDKGCCARRIFGC